ncbi:MAG: DNA repair protein RecO [Flavobacteriaceae bacterium]|nr:DNA repair protein RecO [Flavobacteriaceae bacterium]
MLVSTDAIIISKLKYGDSDVILSCYTENSGIKSYLLKSVLKQRKGKFKPAYLQPLSLVHLNAVHKENRSLQKLQELKPIVHYVSLHTDISKSTVVMFLSEILQQLLKEEERNESLYMFLSTSLQWLDQQEISPNFHLLFLLRLTKYLGFYPDVTNLSGEFFNLESGKFESSKHDLYSISDNNLTLLKQLIGIKFDALNEIKVNSRQRQDFLNMILLYFELHLGGFKKPRSLQILNQIFS